MTIKTSQDLILTGTPNIDISEIKEKKISMNMDDQNKIKDKINWQSPSSIQPLLNHHHELADTLI